jgi:hypothetical protein
VKKPKAKKAATQRLAPCRRRELQLVRDIDKLLRCYQGRR